MANPATQYREAWLAYSKLLERISGVRDQLEELEVQRDAAHLLVSKAEKELRRSALAEGI